MCFNDGRDFGAAIEPLAHADVQTLVARVFARGQHQAIGLGLRWREGFTWFAIAAVSLAQICLIYLLST